MKKLLLMLVGAVLVGGAKCTDAQENTRVLPIVEAPNNPTDPKLPTLPE